MTRAAGEGGAVEAFAFEEDDRTVIVRPGGIFLEVDYEAELARAVEEVPPVERRVPTVISTRSLVRGGIVELRAERVKSDSRCD
jgi:hypothetical protein